jgi:hypothetical protein
MEGGLITWKAGRQTNVGVITSAAETTAILKFAMTKEQHTDIFAKPVCRLNFRACLDFILRDEIDQIGNQRKYLIQSLIA